MVLKTYRCRKYCEDGEHYVYDDKDVESILDIVDDLGCTDHPVSVLRDFVVEGKIEDE